MRRKIAFVLQLHPSPHHTTCSSSFASSVPASAGLFPNCRFSQTCQMDQAEFNTHQNIKAAASRGFAAPHGSFSHQILAVAASYRVHRVSDRTTSQKQHNEERLEPCCSISFQSIRQSISQHCKLDVSLDQCSASNTASKHSFITN